MGERPGAVVRGAVDLETGITTAFEAWGPGTAPVVVLLHPWLESGDAFSLVREHLTPALRFLAPDQRGHGASSRPSTGYDLRSLAADVVAFLDALSVGSALLVGASSGGYVAQEVAASYPDRVRGLVLAGSPRSLHGRMPPFAAEVADLRDPIDAAWARSFVEGFAAPGRVPEAFLDRRLRDALVVPAGIWRESLDALVRSRPPASHLIGAPTVVVSGALDSLVGRREARALAQAIPNARRVEYGDAGHAVHWEQPRRLAADVVALAEDLRWAAERA